MSENLFSKEYKNWEGKNLDQKIEILKNCSEFYEEKAVNYILSNLPKEKQKTFKKDPVVLEFVSSLQGENDVSFSDNTVYVLESILETEDKKTLFFKVARNTICAVFVNLFYNTASDPNKKTKFGGIANGFFASITNEFSAGKEFEADMMQAYEQIVGEVLDLGMAME